MIDLLRLDAPEQLPDEVSSESAAHEELRKSPFLALRKVRCRVENRRLALSGTVPSFYLKQVAQSLLLDRFGDELEVDNQLRVTASPPAGHN